MSIQRRPPRRFLPRAAGAPRACFWRHLLGPLCLLATITQLSAQPALGKQGHAVLVYGNSAVVQDPQATKALLSAVRQASGDGNGTAAGQFEVVQFQPLNLSALPALHATAAYVIPFQAPAGPSYSAAEGAGDNSTAAAALTAFVRGGGNLIVLGNTGTETALSLISRVLGQPLGCKPASAQFKVRQPASAASVLPSVPGGLTEVTLPIGPGAGGEGGGVGLLECSLDSGATPWLQPAADNTMRGVATTLGAPSSVGPAFVWALGRGRVVWLGATYDADTPTEWVDILAAAATAPPAPPEGFMPEPSPPPPSPAPVRCQDIPPPPVYPAPAYPLSPSTFAPAYPPPSGPASSPSVPVAWRPPRASVGLAPPHAPASVPQPPPTPSPPVAAPSAPPVPQPPRPIPPPQPPSPAVALPPSPSAGLTPPRPLPPPPSRADADADLLLLPPGVEAGDAPPEEPESPQGPPEGPPGLEPPSAPDLPAPPVLPPFPPSTPPGERTCMQPCVDFPETRDYNCTAWVEYPDEDFCAPDFYVPDPAGGPDLNVLRDVCPRSCGFCCADKYFECERWAVEGYCSPLYASTDPDTREEEPVPRACQNSCQVCAAQEPPSPPAAPPPVAGGQGRRRLLGRDKGKKAAGGEPTPTLPSLKKDWSDKDLGPQKDRNVDKRLKGLGEVLGGSPNALGFDESSIGFTKTTRLADVGKGNSQKRVDLQKPYGINQGAKVNGRDGPQVLMDNGKQLKVAAVDYQEGDQSWGRVYVPLGYKVSRETVVAGLEQSIKSGRPVSILPPRVAGGKTTVFQPFSEIQRSDNVGWTLVESKVSSSLPGGLSDEGNEEAGKSHVVFSSNGVITLSQPRADIAMAAVEPDTGELASSNTGWGRDLVSRGCGSGSRRSLLQGCTRDPSGGGNGGGTGGGRDCQTRYVRDSKGRRVKRRVCRRDSSGGRH
ncbi:hypothetical protein HYH03_016298 [Edaphochlamys debaryana]|uniref:Uncharacterized protein n=1 Tax=Edaphochlamys debaryana TaxID=47281 RepID=A0A835XKK0_9CHLO|nr:hypothetical protein HYH03_016298 [Edaphochlamys debaryana]|eukprot:KAG2484912.1 hypothetical protein HYH03_016298 [Edaphochlamys debaryana]